MIAPLLLLLLLAESLSNASLQGVLVLDDGSFSSWQGSAAGRARGVNEPSVRHAWVWSSVASPRRLAAQSLGVQAVPPDRSRLVVLVDRPASSKPTEVLTLVAAPVEMWSQVPESLLPSFTVPAVGSLSLPHDPERPWRLRVVGPGRGSWWVEVPAGQGRVSIAATVAQDRRLSVVDGDGAPVTGAMLEWRLGESTPARLGPPFALLRSGNDGQATLASLPDRQEVRLSVLAHGWVPEILCGFPGSLPPQIQLEPGAAVRGRLLDPAGRAIAGGSVAAEVVAPRLAWPLVRPVRTGSDGRFTIRGLPAGEARLVIDVNGYAPRVEDLGALASDLDVGDLRLERGARAVVRVSDDLGAPLTGAEISTHSKPRAATDRRGLAELTGLAPDTFTKVTVTAPRHLPSEAVIRPVAERVVEITLRRSFVIQGRFVDARGGTVENGSVRRWADGRALEDALQPGGELEIDAAPRTPLTLELISPRTRALRVEVPPGEAGEILDLGDLRAPAGLTLTGTVVAGFDGGPVAGARIWLPRPGPGGPLLAWARGDLLQTASDRAGRFRLEGLDHQPALLRIEGAGFARQHRPLRPEPGAESLDLGELELERGTTLTVSSNDDGAPGTVARVDLRGEGLAMDILSAPLVAGRGRIHHVPPGSARLEVVADGAVLCEERVVVSSEAEIEVECLDARTTVRGAVRLGGRLPGPGSLVWNRPAAPSAGVILSRSTASGLRQQEVLSSRGRPVLVEVLPDGTFLSRSLRPGAWEVAWASAAGDTSVARTVLVPEGGEVELSLDFPGRVVLGRVLSEAGEPIDGARVREHTQGGGAVSGEDGRFMLTALDSGLLRLQAEHEDLSSPVVEVLLEGDLEPELVELRLSSNRDEIVVSVYGPSGDPRPSALVFLDEGGSAMTVLTTNAAGIARARLRPPLPARVRVAAFSEGSWSFGAWQEPSRWEHGLSLISAPSGSLLVRGEGAGVLRLENDARWQVSDLLARVGLALHLREDESLRVTGLPSGEYRLTLGELSHQISVESGEETTVRLSGTEIP